MWEWLLCSGLSCLFLCILICLNLFWIDLFCVAISFCILSFLVLLWLVLISFVFLFLDLFCLALVCFALLVFLSLALAYSKLLKVTSHNIDCYLVRVCEPRPYVGCCSPHLQAGAVESLAKRFLHARPAFVAAPSLGPVEYGWMTFSVFYQSVFP